MATTRAQEMCVKVAAAHFRENPMLNSTLPQEYVGKIVKLLPIDLPLELVAHLVEDEDYWKRRSLSRWKKVHTASHGNSWKQTYFEKNLQENIECFDPVTTELVSLERLLRLSKQYVRNLTIRQLPSHLDLELIFKNLREALTSLSLTYGMRNVGMDYDRSLFGMKLSDCRLMAKALESSETLTHLDLSNNLLDDDKVRMVCSGLVDNISVIHLDLSKNKIADRGARAISKLLDNRSCITFLDLSDNQIHAEGGKSMARALRENRSLLSLSLRLNRIGDDAGRSLCDALRNSSSLERLNLSANSLGSQTATSLATQLRFNQSLKYLDISCNNFGVEGGKSLKEALEEGTNLHKLDLRLCGLDEDLELSIKELVKSHANK